MDMIKTNLFVMFSCNKAELMGTRLQCQLVGKLIQLPYSAAKVEAGAGA
jgi:hypothetical protein